LTTPNEELPDIILWLILFVNTETVYKSSGNELLMKRYEYFAFIGNDIGVVFEWLSALTLIPLLIIPFYQEWEMIVPMGSMAIIFFLLGLFLRNIPKRSHAPPLSVALSGVALCWFFVGLVGSIPFILSAHMSLTNAIFESMSGWTTTGLSMITSIDALPKTLIFWRSYTQWLGGIGIISFGIALHSHSGISLFRLYRSEGRPEALMPSIVSTARRIWFIYVVFTVLFTGMLLLAKISLWDALNLVMVGLSTGGFSHHDAGILYFHSTFLEALLLPVMLIGALPIQLLFLLYYRRIKPFLKSYILQFIMITAIVVSLIISADLYYLNGMPLFQALNEGIFCTVSGFTTTGFQNADFNQWAPVAVVLLMILMVFGTSIGSTGGGIKVNRIIIAYKGLIWWFKRFFVRRNVMVPFHMEGKTFPQNIVDLEISKNLLIIIIYFITVFITSVICLQISPGSFAVYEIFFENISALSNVGLSVGYITPASPLTIKWLFIFLMWVGRLEFVAVLVLIMGTIKGFDAIIVK
jgi:trk system potassium uptake protein TrkH